MSGVRIPRGLNMKIKFNTDTIKVVKVGKGLKAIITYKDKKQAPIYLLNGDTLDLNHTISISLLDLLRCWISGIEIDTSKQIQE
jgi:hypothetical protein